LGWADDLGRVGSGHVVKVDPFPCPREACLTLKSIHSGSVRRRGLRCSTEEREVGADQLGVQREDAVDEVYDQLVCRLPTTRQTRDHRRLLASAHVIARQGDRLQGRLRPSPFSAR